MTFNLQFMFISFQNYFRSEVNEFDEPLFSLIALSGGCDRNAVQLGCDEFVNGFDVFLEKGVDSKIHYLVYPFTLFYQGFCRFDSHYSLSLIFF